MATVPVVASLALTVMWGWLCWLVCRLEMNRENSWSVVVGGTAVNLVIVGVWIVSMEANVR